MNGRRFLLDTNAVISLLQGNAAVRQILSEADWIGISIISKLEFLSLPNLPKSDEDLFSKFVRRVAVVGLQEEPADLHIFISPGSMPRYRVPVSSSMPSAFR